LPPQAEGMGAGSYGAKAMEGDSDLLGKTALVTGGACGIGRAIVERFARGGVGVVALDISDGDGSALAENGSASVRHVHCDVTREAEWDRVVAEVFNDGAPDILVNNVGGLLSASLALHEIDMETWDREIALNLTSVFLGMRAIIPLFLSRGGGAIVNVCSISGFRAQDDGAGYQAAKAGVWLLTKNAAVTYARQGIRVNAVVPSVVAAQEGGPYDDRTTGFVRKVPLGRMSTADEVATAVIYLASDAASFVTGSKITVDGGYLA
jgi:NAD(P)-dependent dehydrogenase (short-subunit alcohol dehydrogenase family)